MHLWSLQKYLHAAIIHISDEATKKMAKKAFSTIFKTLEEDVKVRTNSTPKLLAR